MLDNKQFTISPDVSQALRLYFYYPLDIKQINDNTWQKYATVRALIGQF